MSVSSPMMQRPEVQSSTARTKQPDRPVALDDEQSERWFWEVPESAPVSLTVSFDDDPSQQLLCEGGEPSTTSPSGHSYKVDYVVTAIVLAIIVFLWMQ